MKRILGLVLIFICFVTPAFAEGPVSQEILDQARAQAGLFMDLKNALGLEWLDEYNAYLTNPTSSPEPSWASSVTELINKNYLSTAFPTDFTIAPTGQEVTISRTITSQAIKDVLPIYLPSVSIVGDTVRLLVQRPEQWVAWEDALASKVSRAGDDNPDILPGASLEFGSGSKIEFINNDGKLVGINSLTYKGQELEDRFVNAAGDNMTGPLKINGNIVWHAGNDGSGSGLDADLLDGKDSSFFTNAGNLSSGIVPVARLSGTYDINILGNAATATKLATARTISLTGNASGSASFDGSGNISINTSVSYASNADTVDGKHASSFVQKSGDTMTGNLTLQGTSINIQRPETSGGYARGIMFYSKDGSTVEAGIGMLGSENNPPQTLYMGFGTSPWNSSAGLTITPTNITFKDNKVWHSGNDGSGSGLDADLLDGKHASELFGAMPIGVPFPVWDHLSSSVIPPNSGSIIYIKLTAGESGPGGYNYGHLSNESVTGTEPLVEATAVISVGPLAGKKIHLINTEGSFIRAGINSGTLQYDQMQKLIGSFSSVIQGTSSSGAFSLENMTSFTAGGGSNFARRKVYFDSGNSPDARVSSDTKGETRPKNVSATWYMRIQ